MYIEDCNNWKNLELYAEAFLDLIRAGIMEIQKVFLTPFFIF